jgi:hypothetical protein
MVYSACFFAVTGIHWLIGGYMAVKFDNLLEKCIVDGAQGCYNCKYMYKHHCFVADNGDLDYLKALFDLNEEFPT